MLRFPCFVVATVFLSACVTSDDLAGPDHDDLEGAEQLDVSGVWTATLDGTVIHGEDGTGQTTSFTLTLVQSGTELTGSEAFTDTMDREGLSEVSGTLIGNSFIYSFGDFDQQCDDRVFTGTATVTATMPGSTMSISFAAIATSNCSLTSGTLTYTKQ